MMKIKYLFLITMISFSLFMCSANNESSYQGTGKQKIEPKSSVQLENFSKAYFASGCFWCVEAIFESVRGVEEAISGYAGGKESNPTYRQVSGGRTGHAEAVEVFYDSSVVSYETLVQVFYGSHNPTTVNGQHPDYGPQYRSMIYYQNGAEKKIAENFKAALDDSGKYNAVFF